jgi:2-iminoacetate synthase
VKTDSLPSKALSANATNFIDPAKLNDLLTLPEPDPAQVRAVIAKSLAKEALSVEETAVLLRTRDPEQVEEMFEAARQLKRDVYGNRIVLFAPLYVGNLCANDCQYCAFRRSNRGVVRRTLEPEEISQQVRTLEQQGHKRLILVFGEHAKYDADFIAECVRRVYRAKIGHGEIRRVNINAAPLDVAGYRTVHAAGIGTYQVFQETYHPPTYAHYHPAGTRKSDYLYRLDALSRAQEAGIDDVGIGVLFGLYDWRFEVLGLVSHAWRLQDEFGVGPHTISFPRIQPAHGVSFDRRYDVSDEDFKRVVATLRLAVPYTGLILTARERAELRREILAFGVSQIDAGTRIELGGYTEAHHPQRLEREQFQIADIRSLDEVMRELVEDDYIPSFCTACYRLGRTGEHFMEYAIPGFIQKFCTPNALTTLMEYLVDYASPETKEAGRRLIAAELDKMENQTLRKEVEERLRRIETEDARDLYF